jgi:catechol 2,3-dioxygenase-like lactoylglutathione lyase family enzyme
VGVALFLATPASCETKTHEKDGPMNPLADYGIVANNAFFYYDDVDSAAKFYTETLGLDVAADYGFAKILRVASTSYLTLVDATKGMHSSDEPKTVAIALVTDELDAWHAHLTAQGVAMKYDYEPVAGRAHHGFVVLDPEGYYLEFERFNPHAENVALIPILEATETIPATPTASGESARGLGFKATVLWTYYRDMPAIQRFYEETFGLDLLVDQGWAKIYRTSPSGYIGLVDETRGMHRYTERKAVTASFVTDELDGWHARAKGRAAFELRSQETTDRFRAFVGLDPGGYFLEFDTFLDHPDNEKLLRMLAAGKRAAK